MPGSKPGERRGGRKKGSRNKLPGEKPNLDKRTAEEIFLPPSARNGENSGGAMVSTEAGGAHDPHYAGIEDALELLLAVVRDDRLPVNYRMAAAKEVLPYTRSKMSPQPYKPPDHDGRIFINVVKYTEADFEN